MDDTLFEAALDAAQGTAVTEQEEIAVNTLHLFEIGHLKSTVKIGKNEVVLKTLTIGEELEAALLANKYKDTLEEGRALMTALVSMAIVSVNGRPLQGDTLGSFQETPESRFTALREYHWSILRHLYSEYSTLADTAYEEYEELKKD